MVAFHQEAAGLRKTDRFRVHLVASLRSVEVVFCTRILQRTEQPAKDAPVFGVFSCLSEACLGKQMTGKQKWLKMAPKRRFPHQSPTRSRLVAPSTGKWKDCSEACRRTERPRMFGERFYGNHGDKLPRQTRDKHF
jgi:hypothetical protein